ncbi:pentatricopeptide repeat-containing protein At2g30780 isoform X1 [Humulus lupulus]|uniref:pentatricopeptide repeat-containing protein At2g30780 isoform X1 n=1 Tax=Humulus lupulus TaxID=3486 RepID=UPI002B4158C3|nr:pentatricopeptide repeat-containing protein At2g30780 isoform X1 [Humulus lupulus]XP_062086480.1 pentatricopeptide repeat-containing protein At2g30780 isoform X1 [Humulus lupulus]
MKRVWKISQSAQAQLLCHHGCSSSAAKPKTLMPFAFPTNEFPNYGFIRDLNAETHPPPPSSPGFPPEIIGLFSLNQWHQDSRHWEDLTRKVTQLRDELFLIDDDSDNSIRLLEEKGDTLLRSCTVGYPVLELLKQLDSRPRLALKMFQVFDWRRRLSKSGVPMLAEEYTKGIKLAGKVKNVGLAVELFAEAINKRIKTTAIYNALMSAYMFNGFADKCQSLFRDMKREKNCSPNIVTYNILISIFGRLMLLDHMEATFREIKELNISPNIKTYNFLIAGYLTAWMWDSVEITFEQMKESSIKPNTRTYMLLLRGYAHSGNLEKMEETYESIKHYVMEKEIPLIRTMICAYCKSSDKERVKKIEELMKLIPEKDYRPWLNVLLIRVYAEEDWLEAMERSINEAFKHNTAVHTISVMRSIISSYFRCNAVDKLENFIKSAEAAEWRICRSLYHCKMVMYASEKRLEEMESVIEEMKNSNLFITKKTLWILYKAYLLCGQRYKAEQVIGLMCKHGYEIPSDVLPS